MYIHIHIHVKEPGKIYILRTTTLKYVFWILFNLYIVCDLFHPYITLSVLPLHNSPAPCPWWHSGASYHPRGRWQPLTDPLQRFHWECGIKSQSLQYRSHYKYNLKQNSLVWFWKMNDKRHVFMFFHIKELIFTLDSGKLNGYLILSVKKVHVYKNLDLL